MQGHAFKAAVKLFSQTFIRLKRTPSAANGWRQGYFDLPSTTTTMCDAKQSLNDLPGVCLESKAEVRDSNLLCRKLRPERTSSRGEQS